MAEDFAFNWQGYNPGASMQMQGYRPNVLSDTTAPVQPQGSAELARGDYEKDMAELSELQSMLSVIDGKIASVSRDRPRDTERTLASLSASIGDLGPYQTMLARESESARKKAGAEPAINSVLAPAWEVAGQLQAGQLTRADADTLSRKMEVAVQKAEEEAEKIGYDLSSNRYYNDVKAALDSYHGIMAKSPLSVAGFSVANDTEAKNKLESLKQKGGLTDAHIAELRKWRDDNPNDPMSDKVASLADAYAPYTKEAKAKGASKKQKAWNLYSELSALGTEDLVRRVRTLTREERSLLENYHPDILSLTR